ncbi:MAG: hypothetical protein U1F36_11585 [Planctomycetota bacterium]
MARRGRDLFELLRDRSGGSGRSNGSMRERAAASRPARAPASRPASAGGWFRKLSDSARALVAGPQAKAAKRSAAPARAAVPARAPGLPAGAAVVGLVLVALLAGFLLGRFTAPGTPSSSGKAPQAAARIPDYQGSVAPSKDKPAAPKLSAEQEEEELSTLGLYFLQCPARDRARAASCAAWFRDQGLARTRIRSVMTRSKSGESIYWYLVLLYTTAEDQEADLKAVRALELPAEFDDPTNHGGLFSLRSAVAAAQVQDLTKLKSRNH